jgi:hypothetical protein
VTQELIIWVLLAGLVGISWFMAFAITGDDCRTDKGVHTHDSTDLEETGAPSHRGISA